MSDAPAAADASVSKVDLEQFWLSRHLDSAELSGCGGDTFDTFASLDAARGERAAAPRGERAAAPRAASVVAPLLPPRPPPAPAPDASPRTPTAAPPELQVNGGPRGDGASDRWRARMARTGSQDDLLAWSATLGEPVAGVTISNQLDSDQTLIRVTCTDRPGLLLALTEHLQGQQLSIASANVRTHGALACDTFMVHDCCTGGQLSPARHAPLRASLTQLLAQGVAAPLDGDDDEPALQRGQTLSRVAHALTAEQWEIASDALAVDDSPAGLLGSGAFGEVRRGRWRGTAVAVKRIRRGVAATGGSAALELFRRELATYHLLAHPNVVQFLGAVTRDEPLCIVTELLPRGSLADALDRRGRANPPPRGRAVAWALDCAKGMRYLHERRPTQVIHRDLKPANLLIDDSHRLKISDFGLSKPTQLRGAAAAAAAGTAVVSRQTCGSWLYTAPEVLRGEPYTAAVDVFAFGVVLFELLTGAVPYEGLPAERATSHLAAGRRPPVQPPAGVADVPPALATLVERCWAAAPGARPPFAHIAATLEAAAAALPQAAFAERHSGGRETAGSSFYGGGDTSFLRLPSARDATSALSLAWRALRGAALKRAAAAATPQQCGSPQRGAPGTPTQLRKPPRSPTPLPRALLGAPPPPGLPQLRVRVPASAAPSAPLPASPPPRLCTPLAPSLLEAFNLGAAVPRA